MKCKKCEADLIFGYANSFHKLCVFCNKDRLEENKKKRGVVSIKTPYSKERIELLKSVKCKHGGGYVCEGCLKSFNNLDVSHIIAKSLRKDLEKEKSNMNMLCRNCHEIWEHDKKNGAKRLHCYQHNMDYIKRVDELYFNKLKS